jgi:hypothetical protein
MNRILSRLLQTGKTYIGLTVMFEMPPPALGERCAANLKRELPRIPYAPACKALAELASVWQRFR